jgi:GGDEF domain-containing protein
MIFSRVGPHEEARLSALKAYQVLDTAPEETFDRITRLATTVLQVPIALVSLIDRDRQWFKSQQGLAASQTPRDISFCSHAIEQSEPLIVSDATLDPRFADNPFVTGEPHIRFYIGVQLVDRNGFNLGTICCIDSKPRTPTPAQIAILQDLARVVVDGLEMRLLATTDSLTGAMTRRAFLETAHRDIGLAKRHARPLTCALIDADHFKAINDTHGHAAGDQVLRRLVSACIHQLRSSDYICRYGGEEFAIILRETDLDAAFEVAERLRISAIPSF